MIKLKVEPQHMKGPGINIHGPHVTEAVHDLFSYSINANMRGDRFYEARQKAGAFFQGGAHDPKGKWVFIEFWKPETAGEYVELIQSHLDMMSDEGTFLELLISPKGHEKFEERLKWLFDFYEVPVIMDGDNYRTTPTDMMYLTALMNYSAEGIFDVSVFPKEEN